MFPPLADRHCLLLSLEEEIDGEQLLELDHTVLQSNFMIMISLMDCYGYDHNLFILHICSSLKGYDYSIDHDIRNTQLPEPELFHIWWCDDGRSGGEGSKF